jgi:hypothetical protein
MRLKGVSITLRLMASSACVFFLIYFLEVCVFLYLLQSELLPLHAFFFTVRIYFLEVCVFLYLLQGELLPLHAFLLCEFISLKCVFSLYDTERVYCLTVGVFLYILPSVFIAV